MPGAARLAACATGSRARYGPGGIGTPISKSTWSSNWRFARATNRRYSSGLERLPLNDDETTLRTIERMDVLWLRGRSIKRAFEVEHTTSIYSGILRMADRLALQPNMDIRLHIAAPAHRREQVKEEIQRPVFSLLERGALSESCTLISYGSIRQLALLSHLSSLSETVLDEYDEEA
jgi:hypothetical protein